MAPHKGSARPTSSSSSGGGGILTDALARDTERVIAVEKDAALVARLKARLRGRGETRGLRSTEHATGS